jgi:type IV secretory pathway VirB3-like protein
MFVRMNFAHAQRVGEIILTLTKFLHVWRHTVWLVIIAVVLLVHNQLLQRDNTAAVPLVQTPTARACAHNATVRLFWLWQNSLISDVMLIDGALLRQCRHCHWSTTPTTWLMLRGRSTISSHCCKTMLLPQYPPQFLPSTSVSIS